MEYNELHGVKFASRVSQRSPFVYYITFCDRVTLFFCESRKRGLLANQSWSWSVLYFFGLATGNRALWVSKRMKHRGMPKPINNFFSLEWNEINKNCTFHVQRFCFIFVALSSRLKLIFIFVKRFFFLSLSLINAVVVIVRKLQP